MNDPSPSSIETTIPVLAVSNLEDSLAFYDRWFQFKRHWGGEGQATQIASVSRDGHSIMLQRREPLTPGCVWIGMEDIRPLWWHIRSLVECKSCDQSIIQRPTNHRWALDMKIQDPDGNVLWFGSESLSGVDFDRELADEELKRA